MAIKRTQSTLNRLLNNPPPPRPSKRPYIADPNRVLGISFSRQEPVNVAIVDTAQRSTLDECSTEELLLYHRARVKWTNRNVVVAQLGWNRRPAIAPQLQYHFLSHLSHQEGVLLLILLRLHLQQMKSLLVPLELQYQFLRYLPHIAELPVMMLLNLCVANVANDCQAIVRLQEQHRRNTKKQAQEQKQDRYRQGHSESNAREYVTRVIAAVVVALAIDVQAQTIVLPALSNIRETIEAGIRADAQRKFPNYKQLQDQYAKEFRASFHRWNYGMLARCIRERAVKEGIAVEEVTTLTIQGTLADKARAIALAVADKHEFTAVKPE